jgi:ParB family transcriptional regulator, chromosome partitioning protein
MADGAAVSIRTVAAGSIQGRRRTVVAALPLAALRPNPIQPRRHFDPEALRELAASIAARGLLQPIIVKRDGDGFVIMAGERRYRAAQLAGLSTVPALVRDDDPIVVAMIENLQREDLSPLEEAEGLGALIDLHGYTHEGLAELIGKSRPYVSNTLALRRLPEEIKREYHASPDVSREILISVARAETRERQDLLWRLTRLRKLSVQRFRSEQAGKPGAYPEVAELAQLIRRLGRKLRALDTAVLPAEQRRHLERLLHRGQSRILRTLVRLAEQQAAAARDGNETEWADLMTGPAGPEG